MAYIMFSNLKVLTLFCVCSFGVLFKYHCLVIHTYLFDQTFTCNKAAGKINGRSEFIIRVVSSKEQNSCLAGCLVVYMSVGALFHSSVCHKKDIKQNMMIK